MVNARLNAALNPLLSDSKTLSEEQREEMFEKIQQASDQLGWIVDILSPNCISTSMLRR